MLKTKINTFKSFLGALLQEIGIAQETVPLQEPYLEGGRCTDFKIRKS